MLERFELSPEQERYLSRAAEMGTVLEEATGMISAERELAYLKGKLDSPSVEIVRMEGQPATCKVFHHGVLIFHGQDYSANVAAH